MTARGTLQVVEALTPASAFKAWSGYVASLAYKLLGRESEVDDVVQDVFLIALNGLGELRHAGAVKSWLATLTVRTVARRLRVRRFAAMVGFDSTELEELSVAPHASPEQRALLVQVYEVLEALPVRERVAWTLRYVEGEPLDQVAVMCGCSLATAKRRIAAAQERLTEALDVED